MLDVIFIALPIALPIVFGILIAALLIPKEDILNKDSTDDESERW